MVSRRAILIAAIGGVLALALLLMPRRPQGASGEIRQDVYLWQRSWTPPVLHALVEHGTNFGQVIALGAEVAWRGGEPNLARVAIDYEALKHSAPSIGIALRIGNFAGPFTAGDRRIRYLAEVAAELIAEANANGVKFSELQLDFDCAETKLDGYRVWVQAIRARVMPVPVTITALPVWLQQPAFKRLVANTDGYVLQVHSLRRPTHPGAHFDLCNAKDARRAVERAARLDKPFRVALPTYGYLVAFDASGQFAGLAAEGPAPAWPASYQTREVRSDAVAMAALVSRWKTSRPAAMSGVIWYRLPVEGDWLNWSWPTLASVMRGDAPQPDLFVEARHAEERLVEIDIVNTGTADSPMPPLLTARWRGTTPLAADALGGFEVAQRRPDFLWLASRGGRLAPGARKTVGWIRFAADTEVHVELSSKAN